ncbi:MAG: sugar phosphate nucleotidyltransferase [Chloroflexota bacterium]
MKAVVMAGGAGSRLRPLTIERPKPMIPLVNKPVMGHIFDLLKRHGITEVVITVQYLANLIQDFFGDGTTFGMKITYCVEETPLGTAGSVKNAQHWLNDTFLVISGDALTDFDLTALVEYHRQSQTLATLAVYNLSDPVDYGVISLNPEGQIIRFQEKPSRGSVMSDYVNTGIYVLEPEVLDFFPPNTSFDFAQDLFPLIHSQGHPLYGYKADGYWCDVGNISEYMRATADALEGKVKGLHLGHYWGDGIWSHDEIELPANAKLVGPIYLGDTVQIKSGATIYGPTVIRDYTVIDNGAHVERSIIWRNCYIGEQARLSGTVITRQCSLKAKSTLFEGSVIGDRTIIGEESVIQPNVKIWPGKEVEPGSTVNSSIIWGSQGRRVLFGQYGVTGVVNIDLTPEFSAKLGSAFGTAFPKGSTVTINRDMHHSPRMIKRAIISGLSSAGVNVWDLGSQPIPVARYFTRISEAVGGVHVHLSPFDERVVDIHFMGNEGLNLSKNQERDMERIFFREDFRRVYLDDIGRISYAEHVESRYIDAFFETINKQTIQDSKFNLVIDFVDAPVVNILPTILDELNCNFVALNANITRSKGSLSQPAFQTELRQLQTITHAVEAQLGIYLKPGGERIYVVDDHGRLLEGITAYATLVELALRDQPGGTVVAPFTLPSLFEKIAAKYNGRVIRVNLTANALNHAACQHQAIIAGDGRGNFIFPEFQCAVDGLTALVKMLEYLATQSISLSNIVDTLPPYYMTVKTVPCAWEDKAKVMRLLNEKYSKYQNDTINGLKIMFAADTWVLIVPDLDQPYFRLTVEAASQAEADALGEEYRQIVQEMCDFARED